MTLDTKENGQMINDMVEEYKFGMMVRYMKASGSMTKQMDQED